MILELVKPTLEMQEMILEFVLEFTQYNEHTINGCCGLTRYDEYSDWLNYIENVEKGLIADRISSSTYVAADSETKLIIGIIDIRHYLNDEHFYSGHIGYSVRPNQRNKGYGSEILRMGLEKSKELNLDKLMLTCKKDNVASQKVIERNNGILEMEIVDDGEAYMVYWINN